MPFLDSTPQTHPKIVETFSASEIFFFCWAVLFIFFLVMIRQFEWVRVKYHLARS